MNDLPEKTLLRPDEAAEFFRISLRTIYRWIDEGLLVAYKPGRGIRVSRDSILELLDKTRFDISP